MKMPYALQKLRRMLGEPGAAQTGGLTGQREQRSGLTACTPSTAVTGIKAWVCSS